MFQIKPYADKPSTFGLSIHSFVSYVRNHTIVNFNHVCFTKLPFGEKSDIL